MSTLLEKAKAVPVKQRKSLAVTDEQLELAIAWAKGEVTMTQVSDAMDMKRSQDGTAACQSVYLFLARCFRYGISTGKIKVS